MKLFEAHFTFTPDDDSAGEGMVTISAEDTEKAKDAVEEFLTGVPDLTITEIREIVEIPENVDFTPRTVN